MLVIWWWLLLFKKRSSFPMKISGFARASRRLDRKDIRYGDSVCFAVWIGGRAVVVDPEVRAIGKARFEPLGAHTGPRNGVHSVHDHGYDHRGRYGYCGGGDIRGSRVQERYERVEGARRRNRIKVIGRIITTFIRAQPRRD